MTAEICVCMVRSQVHVMCQIMGRLHNPQPNRVQSNSGVLLSCSHDIAGVPRGPGDEAMIQPTIGRV